MESAFRQLCSLVSAVAAFPLTFIMQRVRLISYASYDINGERYVMRNLLGEGGFSFVYKVTDRQGHSYAMKKILAQSEELLSGGLREIEVLRMFGGRPHVLRMVDSIVTDVRPGVKEILILLPYFRRGTVQDGLITK
eukprot:COSAG01_NODE_34709_length_543_cov_1.022523_1_plen_136_part_01